MGLPAFTLANASTRNASERFTQRAFAVSAVPIQNTHSVLIAITPTPSPPELGVLSVLRFCFRSITISRPRIRKHSSATHNPNPNCVTLVSFRLRFNYARNRCSRASLHSRQRDHLPTSFYLLTLHMVRIIIKGGMFSSFPIQMCPY